MARHAFSPFPDVFRRRRSPEEIRRLVAAGLLLAIVVSGAAWATGASSPPDEPPLSAPTAEPRPRFTLGAEDELGGQPTSTATPAPIRGPSTRPHRPDPDPPTAKAPRSQPEPAHPSGLTGRYVLTSTWADGFVSDVIVANPTRVGQRWTVRISYPPEFGVRVVNAWNATVKSGSGALVFTGGPLPAHQEVRMGFQASKTRPAQTYPTSCTVNGARC